MRGALLLLIGLVTAGCGARSGPRDAPGWDYVVAPAPDLRTLEATVCFRGRPPDRLVTGRARLARFVRRAARVDGGARRPLPVGPEGVRLDGGRAGDCVAYVVDLVAAAGAGRWLDAARAGDDVLATPDLWLLRPPALPPGAEATVRFDLPPGTRASVPWPRNAAGAHVLGRGAFTFRSHAAFGRLRVRSIPVGGGRLDVARLGALRRMPGDAPERWLASAGRVVADLYGGLPAPRIQVLLVPVPGGEVRFGMALRGGGAGVVMLVGEDTPPEVVERSWIAYHELTHLGLPNMRREDAWLFEGIATWYTYVLQVRAGVLSPAEGWAALHDGFRRGRRSGTGRSLRDESALMHRTHAWWRVYWGGAAFALEAAASLARRGGPSLDAVLARLARCCARDGRLWSAEEVLTRMDALLGDAFFVPLAERHLAAARLPDLSRAYRALGLVPVGDGVRLDPAPAAARLRRAVLSPDDSFGVGSK